MGERLGEGKSEVRRIRIHDPRTYAKLMNWDLDVSCFELEKDRWGRPVYNHDRENITEDPDYSTPHPMTGRDLSKFLPEQRSSDKNRWMGTGNLNDGRFCYRMRKKRKGRSGRKCPMHSGEDK